MTCDRLSTEALDATYADWPARRSGTAIELKLTMRPNRRRRISLAASRLTRKVPTTLVFIIFAMEAAGVSRTWFIEVTAALLIATSRRP